MSRWFDRYGFAEVHDGLLVGAYPLDEGDVAVLHSLRIVRILNLVEDQEYPPAARAVLEPALAAAGIEEHRMTLTDFGRLPADRLETAVGIVVPWLQEGRRSYLHCRAGWQRSAAVAAGAIAIVERLDIDTALALVQQRKSSADPLPHQREDLREWWERRWHTPRS